MTKEQEEAIEIFEGLKRNKEIIKDIDKDYFFTFAETIINLIQEQQKEIEKKQNRIQELEKALIDDEYRYRVEIDKKEKMIDLMAEWLYEDDTSFGYGRLKEVNTKKRIKQYFEDKIAKM